MPPRSRTRRIFRQLWLRGYLPALALLALWIFSLGCYILWQGKPGPDRRACLGKGMFMMNWDSNARWKGFGTVTWCLGTDFEGPDGRIDWFVDKPAWAPARIANIGIDWRFVVKPGHVQCPPVYAAALLAVPPLLAQWIRSSKPKYPACHSCGYDLRGLAAPTCPECGTPIAAELHPTVPKDSSAT